MIMGKEPLKMRPHHVEGAQRYIVFDKPTTKPMYDLLVDAIAEDAEAEMEFVTTMDDPICRDCISATRGKCRLVLDEGRSEGIVDEMDEEVAREHGWEIGRRYRVQDVLDEITREAPNRTIFYFVAALKEGQVDRDGVQRSTYDLWLEDIRASKGRGT